MHAQPVQLTDEEVAGRLRIAVNRLQRRLRQEADRDVIDLDLQLVERVVALDHLAAWQ